MKPDPTQLSFIQGQVQLPFSKLHTFNLVLDPTTTPQAVADMSDPTEGRSATRKMRRVPRINPSPKTEKDDIYSASDKKQDDSNTPPIEVEKPGPGPTLVDQYSDPVEPPDEFGMEHVREQGMSGFIVKVTNRLRTIPDRVERARERHRFLALVRELRGDFTDKPPYNQAAADKIRQLLEDRGLGETMLLEFELLLGLYEERARKKSEADEKRKQELEEEQRKKQEWDVVREEDADEGWEMI